MSIEIAARFENVDQAEFALVRLRELGIHPQSYRIRSSNLLGEEENETPHPTTGFIPEDGSANYNNLFSFVNAVPTSTLGSASDYVREEVSVHMMLDNNDAQRAQSALISSHGYQIKQY